MFPVVVVLCSCALGASGFNVDTKYPVILSGDKGSYFGYSVAFHKNQEGSLALVTAPKANFTSYGNLVHEPGVLYKCATHGEQCHEVLLDRSGNQARMDSSEYSYHDLKNGSWIGVSLDVQEEEPGHVVTCGHLWKNQLYPHHYLVNGVCYLLNRELQWSATKKLLPLIDRSKQSIIPPGIYYYALGQAGASVAFSEDGKDLLMGAPGFNDWLGTVIEYRVSPHPRQVARPVIPNPPVSQGLTPESYIGYSVTTGHFYELAGMSYVAGAPRDADNNGRVYIFEKLGATKSKIIVQQKIDGGQLGEYFGASLLSVDLNNNGFSDLLVGAPLYSVKGGGDEGRVYIFYSDGVGLQLQKDVFLGSSVPYARFGTAIAKAGDINQDGFQDVLIGAPYEGNGAVYIYHGSKSGLKPQYAQRIAASDLGAKGNGLSGFGISLARADDIDANQYPDLLVGAYSSDKALIFKSRPVAQIVPRLEFEVNQVDLNLTRCEDGGKKFACFGLQACLKLSGRHIPEILGMLVDLWADVSEQSGDRPGHQPRGLFLRPRGQEAAAHLREGMVLTKGRESCIGAQVRVLPEEVQDIISPMTFRMNFSVQARERDNAFCPDCPVLDPALPTSVSKQIHFRTGCGDDNTCSADLNVHAHVVGLAEEEPLILGANNSISVEVQVGNLGEPAYASSVSLFLPPGVLVVNQAKCVLEEADGDDNVTLHCKLGNPLRRISPSVFQVKLDISRMDYRSQELTIKLVSSTASLEVNPKDNAMLLRIPLRALADITIRGHADREQIVYEAKTEVIPIEHTYVILKYYPSPVQSVGVAIYIPVFDRSTRMQILKIESVQVGDSHSTTVPGSCNGSLALTPGALEEQEEALTKGGKDTPNTINLIGYSSGGSKDAGGQRAPQNLKEGGVIGHSQVKERKQSYVMNCVNSLCQTLICSVGPFLDSNKVASIQIKATVNTTAMNIALGNQRNVSLVTGGRVWIRDYDYDPQPYDHRPDEDEVSTDLVPAEQPTESIEIWIIIVAVLAGILLLAIIIITLLKLGFFKREKKEELTRMMQKGSLLPANSDDGQGAPPEEHADVAEGKEADEFDYINFANSNT